MKFIKHFFILFLISVLSQVALAQVSFGTYALKGVNIIDVNQSRILQNQTIVIEGNKISQIIPSGQFIANDSTQIIDLTGKFVIPGLIDAHVHFATDPTEETQANAEKVLKDMLLTGITSVRDMAGDTRRLAGLSRDALVGDITAPNLYYSSLMAGPEFFSDPRTIATAQGGVSGGMSYMRAITDTTNLVLAVAEAKGTGAQGIKLYASLSGDLAAKISKEAHRQHMNIWSHVSLPPTKPSEMIAANMSSISHAGMFVNELYPTNASLPKSWMEQDMSKDNTAFWDAEFAKLNLGSVFESMKKNNIVLDATMSVYESRGKNQKRAWQAEIAKRVTKDALIHGVKVCAGSDTDQATFVQHEMKLLVKECGFTPMQAIISVTKNAAQATGIEDSRGSIEQGKVADLVVIDGDPTEDLKSLDKVMYVIKGGKLYSKK